MMMMAMGDQAGLTTLSGTVDPSVQNDSVTDTVKRRIYRACVHCRQRKSKCDLDSIDPPGKPPCKRCVRENRECVLAGSRRGGRRERKPKPETSPSQADGSQADLTEGSTMLSTSWRRDWSPGSSLGGSNASTNDHHHQRSVSLPGTVENTIASKDIQNPSDALEILAQVAGDVQPDSSTSSVHAMDQQDNGVSASMKIHNENQALQEFPPIARGLLNYESIGRLLAVYEANYHPFFPICPRDIFDISRLAHNAQHSPHLLTAVLSIASADNVADAAINQACQDHVKYLVSQLMYGTGTTVQAVEALLILAEWAVWNQHDGSKPGKGREDASAWMLSGTAIRIGYLLGLDHTSFRSDSPDATTKDLYHRRLVWSACYMSDRQASIRVGRGFWSRGPGPLSGFQAADFPSLGAVAPGADDFATIFKANLELTQIFGNVHDVLYSNRGRELKLILAGDYVKYIDDFRAGIRSWHSVYGTLTCSTNIKISLLLSFDYLRLYVNAFAFQAALARMLSGASDTLTGKNPGLDPDARFIYESVDAAKSILTTVNNFVDPLSCMRYLPLKYFLYIVHAAVFLYKAMATDTMSQDEKEAVRRMIVETVLRLQKAANSSSPGHICGVYARLISLLWRRTTNTNLQKPSRSDSSGPGITPPSMTNDSPHQQHAQPQYNNMAQPRFSWLDLASAADFATANGTQEFSPYYHNLTYMQPPPTGMHMAPDGVNLQQWFDDGSPNLMF